MAIKSKNDGKNSAKISNNVILAAVFVLLLAALAVIYSLGTPSTSAAAATSVTGAATTTSGKPAEVVQWSNGFPSGDHYNLNLHGKKNDFICDAAPGGGSVFVNEYGASNIQFIQNKKSSLTGLYVIDPCSMSPSDPAKIQLQSGQYQVYARILGKPGKPWSGDPRAVVFYPKLIDACNDNTTAPIDGFGDYIDCSSESLIGLGVVTASGVFDKDSQTLQRIAPLSGSNKAVNISPLFQWSGYACSEAYDINDDGQITLADVSDLNGDGIMNPTDLDLYLENYCSQYTNEWIFNIADLLVYGWDYTNFGSKLVQVRFYPVTATTFQ